MKTHIIKPLVLLLLIFTCTDNTSKVSAPNKKIVSMLFEEILNSEELSHLNRFFDDNVIGHDATSAYPIKGISRIRQVYTLFFEAFPDAKYSIEDLVAESDKITVRWRITGKHVGDFMDMKASGNTINVMGIIIYRIKDKRIIEYWGLFDSSTLKKQIEKSNRGSF